MAHDESTRNTEELRIGTVRPPIAVLCGRTVHREEYRRANALLTLRGYIVLSCGVFKGDAEWGEESKVDLDALHRSKIALADLVVVVNPDDVGVSTLTEIAYARSLGKPLHGFLQQGDFIPAIPPAALAQQPAPASAEALEENEWANIPLDMARVVVAVGDAGAAVTETQDAEEHGRMMAESVRLTAEHFNQPDGPMAMYWVNVEGTDRVIAYTGTSPNSQEVSRALAGAWNLLRQHCQAALAAAEAQP